MKFGLSVKKFSIALLVLALVASSIMLSIAPVSRCPEGGDPALLRIWADEGSYVDDDPDAWVHESWVVSGTVGPGGSASFDLYIDAINDPAYDVYLAVAVNDTSQVASITVGSTVITTFSSGFVTWPDAAGEGTLPPHGVYPTSYALALFGDVDSNYAYYETPYGGYSAYREHIAVTITRSMGSAPFKVHFDAQGVLERGSTENKNRDHNPYSHDLTFTTEVIPPMATISGVKFHDLNANGTREAGEEGLEDWVIELYKNVSNVWVFVTSTTTGEAGDYIFSVSEEGIYNITEVLQAGWLQTAPPPPGDHIIEVELGEVYSGLDFGNIMLGSISGAKFYDTNTNGLWDDGELPIEGWKVHLTGTDIREEPVDEYAFTDATGNFTFEDLLPGDYVVTEVFPPVPPNARYINTTATFFEVELAEGEDFIGPDFGNVCLGPGGGRTLGYWSNKNGYSTMMNTIGMTTALNALSALNLVDGNGNPFNPTSYTQFRTWLLNAKATNMAYMLSAQLAAMKLNVMAGFVNGGAFVYAPGVPGANPAGFITVNDLMTAANSELGAHPYTPAGSPYRALQEVIKDALDAANNNLNFVCPGPCLPIVYP